MRKEEHSKAEHHDQYDVDRNTPSGSVCQQWCRSKHEQKVCIKFTSLPYAIVRISSHGEYEQRLTFWLNSFNTPLETSTYLAVNKSTTNQHPITSPTSIATDQAAENYKSDVDENWSISFDPLIQKITHLIAWGIWPKNNLSAKSLHKQHLQHLHPWLWKSAETTDQPFLSKQQHHVTSHPQHYPRASVRVVKCRRKSHLSFEEYHIVPTNNIYTNHLHSNLQHFTSYVLFALRPTFPVTTTTEEFIAFTVTSQVQHVKTEICKRWTLVRLYSKVWASCTAQRVSFAEQSTPKLGRRTSEFA